MNAMNVLSQCAKKTCLLVTGLCLSLSSLSQAQNPEKLLYTVGKTFTTNAGSTKHDYLLWQPGDIANTYGKRFAIYSKAGDADATSNYTLLSVQMLQTSPSAILALLKLGESMDADGASLSGRITVLHAESQGTPQLVGTIPAALDLDVAQKLAQIMKTASTDPEILQSLLALGRTHPGVMMSMGHGFSIKVAPSALTTYEVREVNASNVDVRVIGRVTLQANAPQALVAPLRPHPFPNKVDANLQLAASAKDHLNVRLRWGTPDTLRALQPHTFGYNVYRVPDAPGFNPATVTTAAQALTTGVRVNNLPIPASDLMTDAEAANTAFKDDVFFIADDKNPPNDRFKDGETFWYFAAARDIAGHAGPLSPGTKVVMCDRLPPSQPSIHTVENVFGIAGSDPAAGTAAQHLRVVIEQTANIPVENKAKSYRVYRWHMANDWQTHGKNINVNFIGSVNHDPAKKFVTFDDNNPFDFDVDGLAGVDTGSSVATNQNSAMMGKTVWYTVRSEDDAACVPKNLSGHCSPVYGVLRDRVGPPAPSGFINRCYCFPIINILDRVEQVANKDYNKEDDFTGIVVRVARTDRENKELFEKVKSFDIQWGSITEKETFTPLYSKTFQFSGKQRFKDVVIPFIGGGEKYSVRVRSKTDEKTFSEWRSISVTAATPQPSKPLMNFYQFFAAVKKNCVPVDTGTMPPSDVIDPDGNINVITGVVNLTPGVREVRVFRRIGHDGTMTMIAKTALLEDALQYNWKEDAASLQNGVEACYYAQTFDEHRNSSPLIKLGCVILRSDNIGTPLLADLEFFGAVSSGTGQAKVSWFCDPVGVDRFEVWVASSSGIFPIRITSPDLTPVVISEAQLSQTTADGTELLFETFQTKRLESGFGSGGNFSITVDIPAGEDLYYIIRPVGPMIEEPTMNKHTRNAGVFSNMVHGTWIEPVTGPQAVIPWPARPLPDVANIVNFILTMTTGEGPFYAHPLPAARSNYYKASSLILMGVFPAVTDSKEPNIASFSNDRDPIKWIFKHRPQANLGSGTDALDSSVPFVVYRYQVPSTRFPNAKPNIIQITPMIDRMAYKKDVDSPSLTSRDPFFVFQGLQNKEVYELPVPLGGFFTRSQTPGVPSYSLGVPTAASASIPYLKPAYTNPNAQQIKGITPTGMWLKDSHPAARGASYQYLIVHFDPRGEISKVTPTNIVKHL